jgi:spermidine/putrescine transport system permease protein
VKRSRWPAAVAAAVLFFFYLPIVVLVASSFNASRFGGPWRGFSLKWYAGLLHEPEIWAAARNTLIIAVIATVVSLVLGTLSALALHRFRSTRLQRVHYALVTAPLVVPEILMGISLLMAFIAAGIGLGLATIVLAHVTFCLSYVALTGSRTSTSP